MKLIVPVLLLGFVVGAASCQSEADIEFKRYFSAGQMVYQTRCQNCHNTDGAGLGTLIPPLTDSAFLKTNKDSLACYIYNGMAKPLLIKGKPYFQKMPPSGLTPVEIAEVTTYLINSFGNKAGVYTTEQANKSLAACK